MIIALKFKFDLVFSYKLFKRMNECNLTLFDLQLNAKCLCISFLRGMKVSLENYKRYERLDASKLSRFV